MRVLDQREVGQDEIDELGHLTAPAYVRRAFAANRNLMGELGFGAEGCSLVETDTYRRFHREQFRGARLAVLGGVVEVGPQEIQAYFEIRNALSGDVAATFIIATQLWRSDRRSSDLPKSVHERAHSFRVELPDYGRPRTLDLSSPKLDLNLSNISGRFAPDPMWPDFEWTVDASILADSGFLAEISTGLWRSPGATAPAAAEWTFECDGYRVGWASVEMRTVRVSPVRSGDRLRSVGAEISLHRKVRHSRRWVFEASTGRLVTLNDDVMVALDLDARGTIEIPASVRARLETHLAPELA